MRALITGASSGLGFDMAHVLSEMGYDIVAVARREEKLKKLKDELKTDVEIVICDVTDVDACKELVKYADDIDVFINNAGFGVFGEFLETDLDKELKMLDTNSRAVHILTKLFAEKFVARNHGYILNVASVAAFFPGPLFSAYYASKAYVLRLTQSLAEELRQKKSRVKISALCPGPVHTEFEDIANVNFGSGKEKISKLVILESRPVAEYAIKKMFSGKEVIIPGVLMKIAVFSRRIVSDKALSAIMYFVQGKKMQKK